MSLVEMESRGEIAVILINYPPVNAMGVGVPRGIIDRLEQANRSDGIRAVVLAGSGRGIIAGADIRRQGQPWPEDEPSLRDVINACEQSTKPVIACLKGATLGGGLELVMACNYRVAGPAAQVGQPEVKLGIPPGAGGTQRLPRLAGVDAALDMILSGEPVAAARALELGIIDALSEHSSPDEVLDFAVAFAAERVDATQHRRTRDLTPVLSDDALFDKARERVAKRSPGQRAPQACIECVEACVELPFDEGIRFERRLFDECVTSDEAAALRHLFFAERASRKIPGVERDTPRGAIGSAAVIGSGTMGAGITMCFAAAGIPVTMIDNNAEALDAGLQRIHAAHESSVKRGRLSAEQAQQHNAVIATARDLDACADVDIVVEAVFEEMDIKEQVFTALEKICKPDAILATNTSYLDINQIARAAPGREASVLGTHFFSPAQVMRLLEVVRADQTSVQTLATVMDLGLKLGKLPIISGVCHGFIGNRMFECYRRESDFLLEEGASPQQVDAALKRFGFAMGPLAVGDLAGLDISWRKRRANEHLRDPAKRYSVLGDRLCERGWFGQKTGRGYYRYNPGERTPLPDPEVDEMIVAAATEAGIERRDISDQEIVERCVYALVNEAARILEEGIAMRSGDIDLVYVNGYGFPRWRGGPLHWADSVGLDKVLATIRQFDQQHDFWEPAPLLVRLVDSGEGFASVQPAG